MQRGIYIMANDRVIDQTIALLNSIRLYDSETPIILIPYDQRYHTIADAICQTYGVMVYEDLMLVERLSQSLHEVFGDRFFARPNQFRKQACWFGPFDQFLYLDTDIVVFEKIINTLNYLSNYDFICLDYQHTGGIKNVFTEQVIEDNIFTPNECQDIFNGGFWGASSHIISESDLYETFTECAAHPDYFDFSEKTSDQPIINYMILKRVPHRFNIVRRSGGAPGSWAGSPHFIQQDQILIDPHVNQPLQYLHWAGIRIQPGCPYWTIWEHYRYLRDPKPVQAERLMPFRRSWQAFVNRIRRDNL